VAKHYSYNMLSVAFETHEAFERDKTGRSWPTLPSGPSVMLWFMQVFRQRVT